MIVYVLAMILTINGQGNAYALDSFKSPADCARAVRTAINKRLYDGPGSRVTARFQCERTRIVKR